LEDEVTVSAVAKRMVAEMGYGRREREVGELEAALGAG
jgi:hypothetical protein